MMGFLTFVLAYLIVGAGLLGREICRDTPTWRNSFTPSEKLLVGTLIVSAYPLVYAAQAYDRWRRRQWIERGTAIPLLREAQLARRHQVSLRDRAILALASMAPALAIVLLYAIVGGVR